MGGTRGHTPPPALEPVAAALRPRTWAEIDLDAFARNLALMRRRAPGGRILAVLKADAYGHGATTIARVAVSEGAEMLGVGDSTEALELRRAGIGGDILILGSLVPMEIHAVVASGITPVIHSLRRVDDLEAEAARQKRCLPVHLKVDTGMGRLGMRPSHAMEAARRIARSPHLALDGLMSHLAGTGPEGASHNRAQARRFAALVAELHAAGITPPRIHLRNTTGILDGGLEVEGETLARSGAGLFGFSPDSGSPGIDLAPVLSLRTQIVYLKDVPAGAGIGYGGTFVTRRPTRLGIIPMGYHDGMKRSLGNRGEVLVRGRRARIVGNVSMDYSTLDITDILGGRVGDEVTIVGADGGERLSIEKLAADADTIPYEILCGLGRRVVRIPRGGAASSRATE